MEPLTPEYARTARPDMVAMEGKCPCSICKESVDKFIFVDSAHVTDKHAWDAQEIDANLFICQPCINRLYAKACAEFNIRPHKLY